MKNIDHNYKSEINFDMFQNESLFKDCYTLDPLKVEEAWEKLSINQVPVSVGSLPQILHRAFVVTLGNSPKANAFINRKALCNDYR